MRTGERIRLIEEAHDRLMARKWTKALLVLRQIGFDCDRDWRDERDDDEFTLDVISAGGDDKVFPTPLCCQPVV